MTAIRLIYNDEGRLVRWHPTKMPKAKPVPKPVKRAVCPDCDGFGSTQDGGMFSQLETCERCAGTGLKSLAKAKWAVEQRERAELARLLAKYPAKKTLDKPGQD